MLNGAGAWAGTLTILTVQSRCRRSLEGVVAATTNGNHGKRLAEAVRQNRDRRARLSVMPCARRKELQGLPRSVRRELPLYDYRAQSRNPQGHDLARPRQTGNATPV